MLPARRFNGQYGISDFFNDFFDNRSLEKMGNMTPAINVMENDKGYLLELAAPGMCKDDFKVHLNKDGFAFGRHREIPRDPAEVTDSFM